MKLFLMPMAQSPGLPPFVAQPEAGAEYHDASTTNLSFVPLAPMPPASSIGASVAITVRSPVTVTRRGHRVEALPPVM